MSLGSPIEWTESTWNPVTGCTKVSPGCKHCYAERMARRLQAMGQPNYAGRLPADAARRTCWSCRSRWKKPQTIFVNSMSDLFHEDVPLEYIQRVFDVCSARTGIASRSSRSVASASRSWLRILPGPPNVWMGVSVENADYAGAIDDLRDAGAAREVPLARAAARAAARPRPHGIDWVIVGGESGPGAGRWSRSGSSTSATSAARPRCRSSSSSGAASTRRRPGACSTGGRGTRCPPCETGAERNLTSERF